MIHPKTEYSLTIHAYITNDHFFGNYFGRKTMHCNYPFFNCSYALEITNLSFPVTVTNISIGLMLLILLY